MFIGFAFLTKTLQAFLVVPGFALAYLVAGKTTCAPRVAAPAVGGLGASCSRPAGGSRSSSWCRRSTRPYIGGSQDNSFLELTFGYNGLGRITGDETGSVGGGGGAGGTGMWGATGLERLFNSEIGGQISWLHPGRADLAGRRLWSCADAVRAPTPAGRPTWSGAAGSSSRC